MEMNVEKRKETITRLLEAHDLLFKSMIKLGSYTKYHGQLFSRIRKDLEKEAYLIDDVAETEDG
jgi:hypothetical protein